MSRSATLHFCLATIASTAAFAQFQAAVEFTPSQRLASASFSERISLADLNGDGNVEAISEFLGLAPEVLFGREGGSFADQSVPALPPGNYDLGIGDVDGDGDLDLVGSMGSILTTHFNNGAGVFTTGPQGLAVATASPLALRDFDGDGFLDVAMHMTSSSQIDLFFGDGTGSFSNRVTLNLASAVVAFAALQLGGGTTPEIVTTHSDRSTSILRQTSGRNFTVMAGASLTYTPRIEQVIDFDGDGFEDLLLSGHRNDLPFAPWGVALLSADGLGGLRPEVLQHVDADIIHSVRAGSFDGAGPADLFVSTAGGDILWQRNANGMRRYELSFPYRAVRTTVGDLDRDGDLDLLRSDGYAAVLRTWTNQSRHEIRLSFDETSGAIAYDSARGNEDAYAFRVLGNPQWQGDPGPGREGFRGNDPGTGMLARARGTSINTQYSAAALRLQEGSFTVAWWQRMGSQGPNVLSYLFQSSGLTIVTGDPVSGDRFTALFGSQLAAQAYTSATRPNQVGRWTHVAITVDAATGAAQFWFDGVRDANAMQVQPQNLLPFGFFSFGANSYAQSQASLFFDFDEFRYIPRALNASEVAALLSSNALSVAPMGAGCFERNATEGLHVVSVPRPGSSVELRLDTTGLLGGSAVIAFGISSAHFGGGALPLDLGFGCVLRTSIDAIAPMAIGRIADLSVPLPLTPGSLQGHVYVQALILGPGIQTTRAFDLRLRY